ncbi:MAG: ATP-binding protein, partial [Lachnospiraceae bacterium]|nr:ATP-binding protein [Lachnospiraceae bacterium]
MHPVNIYELTRIKDYEMMMRLERQMSRRSRIMPVKEWEIDGIKKLSDHLCEIMQDGSKLNFYYSFIMPKLGKEFDLLRINDDVIINIELKSGNVSDDTVKMQLMHNKYYLSTLGREMRFYTYLSNSDRLVRLSRTEKIVDTSWEELADVLSEQKNCYSTDIEELFKEDKFLISPLTDPQRFLRKEYFLTSQQRDIRKQILRRIGQKESGVKAFGFSGFPGTGKTLLLYDLAMQLSEYNDVAVLHFGPHVKELQELDERLKRVDFYYCDSDKEIVLNKDYSALLIDEGNRMSRRNFDEIIKLAKKNNAPLIFSYDMEQVMSANERKVNGVPLIEGIEGYVGFKLTNRIRLNSELYTFIKRLMSYTEKSHAKYYPSVSVAYANNDSEADILLKNYIDRGYTYIYDDRVYPKGEMYGAISAMSSTCKEYDKVLMILDESFNYDREGYLRGENDECVRNIFHGLSRA